MSHERYINIVQWHIFPEVGVSTGKLGALNVGDTVCNVVGPLGNPSEIKKYGLAAVIGGGVGTPFAYPVAKALRKLETL